MPGETLIEQLTELLLSQLKDIASSEEDLRKRENDVLKLGGTLSKFKRSKQIRKLIEDVRPFMESLPNFYGDFYSIIKPKICYSSYAAKFFDLVDVILSSSHIPIYIVAAYVKKLSRLLLMAPLTCQLPIIILIKNVLHRHKAVHELLINRKDQDTLESDPYDENERDLTKCGAKNSSLWEIRTIQQHWNYKVADKANFIDRPAPDEDVPLAWQTADEIFLAISKKVAQKLRRQNVGISNNTKNFMLNGSEADAGNSSQDKKETGEENRTDIDEEKLSDDFGGFSDEDHQGEKVKINDGDFGRSRKRARLEANNFGSVKKSVDKVLVNALYAEKISSQLSKASKVSLVFGLDAKNIVWTL